MSNAVDRAGSFSRPTHEFSPLRKIFWPIHGYELKKFVPMVLMMLLALFSYTTLRIMKDNFLATAPHSDAKVLPFAKIFFVTPLSIAFVIAYAKMSNVFSKQKLFYATLLPFAAIFFLFGFVVYPMHESLNFSPDTLAAWQESAKDSSVLVYAEKILPVLAYWTFTLFYAAAELWGNVGVSILFWQFANQITPTAEAKRFYPMYGFWANLGLILASAFSQKIDTIVLWLSGGNQLGASGEHNFTLATQIQCGVVGMAALAIAGIYWWMNKNVLTDPRLYDEAALSGKKSKSKKPKMDIGESFRFLLKSKYLFYIMVLVLSYGISINLVEVSWKQAALDYYKSTTTSEAAFKIAYNKFMSGLWMYVAIATMVLIPLSQTILRWLGWKFAAVITPWVGLITSSLFFLFVIFQDQMDVFLGGMGIQAAHLAIWIGLVQNVLTKGAKYSLFDPTKEMAYIPLDEDSKIKGKAAIDVMGGRMGKSGGSTINAVVAAFTKTNHNAFLVFVGTAALAISVWWIWAVEKLSKEYALKLEETEAEKETSSL
jgi:ATP:ADP antiporter, AAA family